MTKVEKRDGVFLQRRIFSCLCDGRVFRFVAPAAEEVASETKQKSAVATRHRQRGVVRSLAPHEERGRSLSGFFCRFLP